MLPPVKRQPHETLESWEARLIADQPARELQHARAATMALSDAEYRIKVALLTAPPRLHIPTVPDCRDLSDAEYAAVKKKAGIFHASLR